MSTTIIPATADAVLLEAVLLKGDLKDLSPAQRVTYYRRVCDSLGLNPLTKPFDYIVLNGKLTLYVKRDATDQLRRLHAISVQITSRENIGDLFVVTARATGKDGRTDESIGAVNVAGLKGEALANAMMKAETKGKRRVTLSIAGLGWLDESEASAIPDAAPANVDAETGEIHDDPQTPTAAATALKRLEQLMTARGITEGQMLLTARKRFGEAVRQIPDLRDPQLLELIEEIEGTTRQP